MPDIAANTDSTSFSLRYGRAKVVELSPLSTSRNTTLVLVPGRQASKTCNNAGSDDKRMPQLALVNDRRTSYPIGRRWLTNPGHRLQSDV